MIDLEDNSPETLLSEALKRFGSRFAIITSFQAEGVVLVDMASRLGSFFRVITVDTGRLHEETYQVIEEVRARYGIPVEVVSPDPDEISTMVTRFGPNLFRQEVACRNLCCQIRKVRPLEHKLAELSAHAVGLRREQSETRQHIPKVEEVEGRWKLSPLADWTSEQVWHYIRERDLPVHPLYARGYRSIGCAPCTRAVAPGEDERAGRWWWEQDALKECGIHFTPDGQIRRKLDVMLEEVIAR